MSRTTLKPALAAVCALAAGLLIMASPALAQGKLDLVGKYTSGDQEIDVATIADQGKRTVRLDVVKGESRTSIVLNPDQLGALLDLWDKAGGAQSDTWMEVGAIDGTAGPKGPTHLTLSAGKGVRFVLQSPPAAAVTFDLDPDDTSRFDLSLHEAQTFLDGN